MADSNLYVNGWGGSFKVWLYELHPDASVTTRWGRIGLPIDKLQNKLKQFHSGYAALSFAHDKAREKECKGYVPFPAAIINAACSIRDGKFSPPAELRAAAPMPPPQGVRRVIQIRRQP